MSLLKTGNREGRNPGTVELLQGMEFAGAYFRKYERFYAIWAAQNLFS